MKEIILDIETVPNTLAKEETEFFLRPFEAKKIKQGYLTLT